MKKLNLDNVQEFTRFKNPVGGFICEIKSVEDVPDKEYLRIGYDIAEALNEEQKELDEKKSLALRKCGIQVFRIQEGGNNQKENNII